MKKVLFSATVDSHIFNFHIPDLIYLKENNFEVHVASNGTADSPSIDFKYNVPFQRSPYKIDNIKAFKQLKKIIVNNDFDIIHCHTPMGGVITRLAAISVGRKNTKIIYTAHGFHFFKGAPLINWLMYYPIERWLARYTDLLITINKEDYRRALSFKSKKVKYLPGVGLDTKKFAGIEIDRDKKQIELEIPFNTLKLISVGELNKNKNHEIIIKAIAKLGNPNISYLICGVGEKEEYLKKLSQSLGVSSQVKFLGYRSDINEILKIVDVFVFPSFREGLSLALMEAMGSSLPVICSDIRGNTDLIENEKGGYLVKPDDLNGFITSITKMIDNPELRESMGAYNIKYIEKFDRKNVLEEIEKDVYLL
ncbi:glycosyltransferase family 4 protein [Paenibacillus sp. FSL R10-2796]|uniref:glycosyltransferase family 4 protein n=1 Tax=Paenibacillus sp. FSL R10-2796 TaxID=2954663 RepID=UPI0030D9CB95